MAGNSVRVLGAQVSGNIGYLVSVLLLARALPPAGRGTMAFVTVTALVTAAFSGFGVGEATKVFAATRTAARARLLSNVMLLAAATATAAATVTCGALALLPGVRPRGVGSVELLLLGAGTVAYSLVVAGLAFLQGCGRFRAYTRVLGALPWVYAVLLAGIAGAHGLTVRSAIVAWVAAQAAFALAAVAAGAREAGFGRPDRRLAGETVRFGVRAWIGGLAQFLNARTDQVLMGLISTEAALGVYAVAVNASEVLFYVPSAVAASLLPAVARDEPARGLERALQVFRIVAVITLAEVALAAALGPVLLPLAFGGAYHASVGPFLLLLPSALGFAATAIFSNALLACSLPVLSSLGPTVAVVSGVALDLLLIPRFGASGAAVAASVALLAGGAAAAAAYRTRARLPLSALVPRRADLSTVASLRAARRADAMPS
jgi:O-antigen/teichoic acid export membrane protein